MNAVQMARPVEILLVEDNPGDARLAVEVLKADKLVNNLSIVEDGVEAMAFLRREGKYANAVRPDLILLDLNLPRKSGSEVLAEIKADEDLKHIPVVMLATLDIEEDILRSYDLHANCYIVKPIDLEGLIKVAKSIDDFWLSVVKLPPKDLAA